MWLIELIDVLTTIIQFLTGVGGLLFDIFFQGERARPHDNAARKKTCAARVSFGPIDDEIGLWPMLLAIVLAIAGAGTRIYVIERM